MILSLKNVSKSFGALTVADDVTLDVPHGRALGVIGPNGAGKSTLFNLITGNMRADHGSIYFEGCDVTTASPMERCLAGIGRSFQIPQPFEKLTVFENLVVAATNGRNLTEAAVLDDCAEILQRTELLGRANILAGRLSLLERKRLELSRAMATQPKLLLLDEIAGGLTEGECKALIQTSSGKVIIPHWLAPLGRMLGMLPFLCRLFKTHIICILHLSSNPQRSI
jgi:branched-chain amino acid transport system ATP-binding protein